MEMIQTQPESAWIRYFSWCCSKIKDLWQEIKPTYTHKRTHTHTRAWTGMKGLKTTDKWDSVIWGQITFVASEKFMLFWNGSSAAAMGLILIPPRAQTTAHGLRRLYSSNTSGDSPAFLPPLVTSKHEYMQNSRFLVRTFSCCSSKMMKYVSSFGKLVKQCFSWYWGFITFYEWEFLSPGGMFALHDCPNSHKGHIGWMICPILYLFYM